MYDKSVMNVQCRICIGGTPLDQELRRKLDYETTIIADLFGKSSLVGKMRSLLKYIL